MLRLCRPFAVSFIAFAFAGCGSPWATVEGVASLDDKALDRGNVVFLPVSEGPSAYGTIGADGRFRVSTGNRPGLKPGEYVATVSIQTIPEDGKGQSAKILTPLKYATRESSDLRVTIRNGKNDVKLELSSK